jgi:mannan endo-1,4-beta-mannosidase
MMHSLCSVNCCAGDIHAAGKDTLDFYADPSTRALYKLHIWGLLSRVNPLTGLAPKDDPAIFSYNIINEPRCPGASTTCDNHAVSTWDTL